MRKRAFLLVLSFLCLYIAGCGVKDGSSVTSNNFLASSPTPGALPKTITVAPGQSIQDAINSAKTGDTVFVQLGDYNQQVRIDKNITLTGQTREENGEVKKPRLFKQDSELVKIENVPQIDGQSVLVSNFELTGSLKYGEYSTNCDSAISGITVIDSNSVTIEKNRIHGLGHTECTQQNTDCDPKEDPVCLKICNTGDAHGITIAGNTRKITIRENEISDMHLGRSEGITIHGGVTGFSIEKNIIKNIDNIAIDLAGYYDGTPPSRKGLVEGNRISGLQPGNCAYPDVGGIYVDGGNEIVVSANEVKGFGRGIDINSEQDGAVENIVVRNNLLRENLSSGIGLGSDGSAKMKNVRIFNNTLLDNNTLAEDQGSIRFGSSKLYEKCRIANNFVSNRKELQLVTNDGGLEKKVELQSNLFFSPNANNFSNDSGSFVSFKKKFKTVGSFLLQVPVLGSDFGPVKNSPLCNSGDKSFYEQPETAQDFAGMPRLFGTAIDIGAIEYQKTCGE